MGQLLGTCPADDSGFWTPSEFWDAEDLAIEIGDHPCVSAPELTMQGAVCEEAKNMVRPGWSVVVRLCRSLAPQRAEFQGAIMALQAFWPWHVGIDNLNVVRSIGRSLDHVCLSCPLPLVYDGDLIAVVQHMIIAWGPGTVKVTKVKGHATEADVEQGRVWLEDRLGKIEADTAADLGRRHQFEGPWVLGGPCLPPRSSGIRQLRRFMVAMSWVSVNHDGRGGSAPDPLVWDQGSRGEQRGVDVGVNVDLAVLPGPPGFLNGPGFRFMVGALLVRTLLLGLTAALGTWVTLGFLTWRFSFSLSNGLDVGCSVRWSPVLMFVRTTQFSISSRFLSSLVGVLCELPGRLGRFLPRQVGRHMPKLRHLGWEQCSQGLTSRVSNWCSCGAFGWCF